MNKLDERDVIANCEYYALTVPRMAAALFKRTGKTMAPPKMVGSNGKALDLLERHALWTDHFHALSRELYAAESRQRLILTEWRNSLTRTVHCRPGCLI
jgi:hypothetical protein